MPHIHEKIDFTVEVFVVYKDKVLLRMHDKYKLWLSVGGHVELDEDPNEAAIREVKEEVGLDISLFSEKTINQTEESGYKELIVPNFLNIHSISPSHRHITLTYFGVSQTDHVTVEKNTDIWKWVTKKEIDEMDLRPHVKKYAVEALDKLTS